jgi:hypothetical protein
MGAVGFAGPAPNLASRCQRNSDSVTVPHVSTYEITTAISELAQKPFDPYEFPYDVLRIYRNTSNTTIAKLKAGDTNPAQASGGVLLKKYLYFQACSLAEDPAVIGEGLVANALSKRNKPRFVLVTNGLDLFARDTKTGDTDNHKFSEDEHWSHFLLPLAPGHDRPRKIEEHPADEKAARLLGRLYDAILKVNPTWNAGNHTDALNHFMTRLLFCLYAEDTGIFPTKKLFTNTLTQHSLEDGSDLAPLLGRLFTIMNVEQSKRPAKLSPIEAEFPYVNGSLFEGHFPVPIFDRFARRQLLDCGEPDWTDITPDIFGSMIQTISDPSERANTGMHYTSVRNIRKVLRPLFLDNLNEAYIDAQDSVPRLAALLDRISRVRVFDPACGSGNFLLVSYKQLRALEMRILERMAELAPATPLPLSQISLESFFGIDIAPFACETARLSLWIAEHQENTKFKNSFGNARPALPLPRISTIYCANALRIDWFTKCPKDDAKETYVCGNPQFQGHFGRTESQNEDMRLACADALPKYKDIDYVACWLIKLARYITAAPEVVGAFVTTVGICQGEQVPIIWPFMLSQDLEIVFSYAPFQWSNFAAHNAAVTCVIIGLAQTKRFKAKTVYAGTERVVTANINPYLVPSKTNVIVQKAAAPLNQLPGLKKGNKTLDGGNLMLSQADKDAIVGGFPDAKRFIRRIVNVDGLLSNEVQYVLYISDTDLVAARGIPPIAERLARTAEYRRTHGIDAQRIAEVPHRFGATTYAPDVALAIPQVSAEQRRYIPVGFLKSGELASQQLFLAYRPPSYLLPILSSRLHLLWAMTIGRITMRTLRYSATLVYNTFPMPALSSAQEQTLDEYSKSIIRARERHIALGKTLAWLYDPRNMPPNLLAAHQSNDIYIEEHVYGRSFRDDTHRLEHLFNMYARVTTGGEQQASLLEAPTAAPQIES